MCVTGYVMHLAGRNSNTANEQIKKFSDFPCLFLLCRGTHCYQLFVCLSRDIQLVYQKIYFVVFPFCTNDRLVYTLLVYLLNLFNITILFGDYLLSIQIYLIFSILIINIYNEVECKMKRNFKIKLI